METGISSSPMSQTAQRHHFKMLHPWKTGVILHPYLPITGDTVASWLVWVGALARDIALCSWATHFTLTVPLSTQVYKWVLANLMPGIPCDGLTFHPGEVKTLLVASCYRNQDKLRPDGLPDSYADFTLPYIYLLIMATSPQQPLSSVPMLAVVERFIIL